jgi:hypothetical protein
MKWPSPPSPLSPGEARNSVAIIMILASNSETWANSATGFPQRVTAVTAVTAIQRIARTCAESAMRREFALSRHLPLSEIAA